MHLGQPSDEDVLRHYLRLALDDSTLRWRKAGDVGCIMLPVSQRVPGVYTLLALSRYRQALLLRSPAGLATTCPPLVPPFLATYLL